MVTCLPGDLSTFVGRAAELASVVQALDGRRLVTRASPPAERSVAELAVRGLSNPRIAAEPFIGRGTVKTYLARAYAKLGVANRTEPAATDPKREPHRRTAR